MRGRQSNGTSRIVKTRDIIGAEALVGVQYTKAERAQILASIDEQLTAVMARRDVKLRNSVPMASRFDPRLPGFEMPFRDWVEGGASTRALPTSDEDIAFASLADQAHWLRKRQITSRRLTGIYLARIRAADPALKAWAHVAADLALAQADEMDAMLDRGQVAGPLHGVPYGVKDLFDTMGLPTGWGAEPYEHRVPEEDAAVVRLMRKAGAVLLGKTAMGALAYGDIWYGGQTRNPWNPAEGSSGSSAGSAAAVAAGLCSFAIGTETLGSIVSPSERCGATGLRPTFGRVSRAGAMTLSWTLDKVGPIARTVEDTGLLLAVLNGHDPQDRSSIKAPYFFDATREVDDLTIGYLPTAFEGADPVHMAALEAVRGLGMKVVEAKLPELPYDSLINILLAEAAAAFEDLTLNDRDDLLGWQDDDAWPNTFRRARFLSAVDHVQLERLRYKVMEALNDLFSKVDVLIGPMDRGPMLVASNFTGHPCLHLRAGFADLPARARGSLSAKRGKWRASAPEVRRVPQGISLWAGLFNEGPMLNVGMALEAALGVADERPPKVLRSAD